MRQTSTVAELNHSNLMHIWQILLFAVIFIFQFFIDFSQILNFQNYFQWLLEDFRRLILGISGGLKGGMRDKETGELKIYVPSWKPDSGGGGSGSGGGCCGGCVIL